MFIEGYIKKTLPAPEERNLAVAYIHRQERCAPLERESSGLSSIYKHLALLEPRRRRLRYVVNVAV